MEEKLICALLFGEAETEKIANDIARSLQNCPYIYFITTKEKQVFAVFFLPSPTIVISIITGPWRTSTKEISTPLLPTATKP
jgi:hypothetical protein